MATLSIASNLPSELVVCTGKLVANYLGSNLCHACDNNSPDVRKHVRRVATHAFLFERLADNLDGRQSLHLDSDEVWVIKKALEWWDGGQASRTRPIKITIGWEAIEPLLSLSDDAELSQSELTVATLA